MNQGPIDGYSAFGLISKIYQSNLSFRVKNDCVCRVLAHRYNINAVSLLLYDGQKDKLVNRGSYIHETSLVRSVGNLEEDYVRWHMLRYISFYDFLYYKYYRTGIPATIEDAEISTHLEEFGDLSNTYFNYNFDMSVLNPEFVRTCHANSIELATNKHNDQGYYKLYESSFYNSYKRKFTSSEQYIIGPNESNYSGRVFWMVISGTKKMPDTKRPFVFKDEVYDKSGDVYALDDQYKYFLRGLEKFCGYSLAGDLNYCGIPLWTDGRCIGVVRLLLNDEMQQVLSTNPDRIKSLMYASEVLANFLDQSYPQEFVDRIVHDWSDKPGFNNIRQEGKTDAFCSSLRQAMNSFGCVLRLSDYPADKPTVAGKSTDSPYFSDLVERILQNQKKDGFIIESRFNHILLKCFSSAHSDEATIVDEKYRLVGIAVDLGNSAGKGYVPTYYYCHAAKTGLRGSERVRETLKQFIFKQSQSPSFETFFHADAYSALKKIPVVDDDDNSREISIRYVLIMDIPALDVDGVFTFSNTANRPFSLSDARFAYGEMKRFGLEVSRLQKERLKSYKDISNAYFHDLKNIIKICIAQSKHLQGASNPADTGLADATYLTDFLEIMKSKIVNFQRFAAFNMEPKIKKLHYRDWNIENDLQTICKIISVVGLHYKGTRVWYRSSLAEGAARLRVNKDIIDLCFFNLLENAMKYSYGLLHKSNVPGFDPADEKTPGHVHVSLDEDERNYIIRLVNWGCKITDPNKVFEKRERSNEADDFLKEENREIEIASEGITHKIKLWQRGTNGGLSAVSRFISELNGNCRCEAKDDINTFILKFQKNEKARSRKNTS